MLLGLAARPLLVMQGADVVWNLQLLSQLGIMERELSLEWDFCAGQYE
jgi:hypothetical protein